MVSPPTGLLHGHNSSVCKASNILSVSEGFLPTFKLFTVICCIILCGYMINVALYATPSSDLIPNASTNVPWVSENDH